MNRNILITGSSRGIGAAITKRLLAEQNVCVWGVCRSSKFKLRQVSERMIQLGADLENTAGLAW